MDQWLPTGECIISAEELTTVKELTCAETSQNNYGQFPPERKLPTGCRRRETSYLIFRSSYIVLVIKGCLLLNRKQLRRRFVVAHRARRQGGDALSSYQISSRPLIRFLCEKESPPTGRASQRDAGKTMHFFLITDGNQRFDAHAVVLGVCLGSEFGHGYSRTLFSGRVQS